VQNQLKTTTQSHKKNNHGKKHPAPSNKLTVEIQFYAKVVVCNVWETGSALKIMKTARAKQQINKINNNIACVICRQRWCMVAACAAHDDGKARIARQ
jgi:hypothetical protein